MCFQIYPVKSIYVHGRRKYIEPHTHVEQQVRIQYICDSNVILFIDEATRFVRDTVKRVITTLCLIYYKDVKNILTQILTKHAVLLSDRLIQILKYTRDLLVRVKGYMYMYMWCKCGAYLAKNE